MQNTEKEHVFLESEVGEIHLLILPRVPISFPVPISEGYSREQK